MRTVSATEETEDFLRKLEAVADGGLIIAPPIPAFHDDGAVVDAEVRVRTASDPHWAFDVYYLDIWAGTFTVVRGAPGWFTVHFSQELPVDLKQGGGEPF